MTCIDFRFHEAIYQWAKDKGLQNDFDLVSMAGVQKSIIDEDTRAAVLKQLDISVRLHKSHTVILIAHQDCGAYGGSVTFASWDEEKAKYIEDLNKAEELIYQKFSNLNVRKMVLTFDSENKIEIIEV